ncbi:Serine/arginine repetitive matrix protein 2, partial [Branchiostoma belcheri]
MAETDKLLFEKFWKGTFKAVVAPRHSQPFMAALKGGNNNNNNEEEEEMGT